MPRKAKTVVEPEVTQEVTPVEPKKEHSNKVTTEHRPDGSVVRRVGGMKIVTY